MGGASGGVLLLSIRGGAAGAGVLQVVCTVAGVVAAAVIGVGGGAGRALGVAL